MTVFGFSCCAVSAVVFSCTLPCASSCSAVSSAFFVFASVVPPPPLIHFSHDAAVRRLLKISGEVNAPDPKRMRLFVRDERLHHVLIAQFYLVLPLDWIVGEQMKAHEFQKVIECPDAKLQVVFIGHCINGHLRQRFGSSPHTWGIRS